MVISSRDEGMSDSEGVNRANHNEGKKMTAALCSRPDFSGIIRQLPNGSVPPDGCPGTAGIWPFC